MKKNRRFVYAETMIPEGKDLEGYVWVRDPRYDDYYYLKDFEHMIVMKVNNWSEKLASEHWEGIIYEDETCSKVVGREEFATEQEAKAALERIMELTIRNRALEQ